MKFTGYYLLYDQVTYYPDCTDLVQEFGQSFMIGDDHRFVIFFEALVSRQLSVPDAVFGSKLNIQLKKIGIFTFNKS